MSKYCIIFLILCLAVQSPLGGCASLPTPPRRQSPVSPSHLFQRLPVTPPSSATGKAVFYLHEEDDEHDTDFDEFYDDDASSSSSSFEDEFDEDEMEEWDHAVEAFHANRVEAGFKPLASEETAVNPPVAAAAFRNPVVKAHNSLFERMKREQEIMLKIQREERMRWEREQMIRKELGSMNWEYESEYEIGLVFDDDELIFKFDDLQ